MERQRRVVPFEGQLINLTVLERLDVVLDSGPVVFKLGQLSMKLFQTVLQLIFIALIEVVQVERAMLPLEEESDALAVVDHVVFVHEGLKPGLHTPVSNARYSRLMSEDTTYTNEQLDELLAAGFAVLRIEA